MDLVSAIAVLAKCKNRNRIKKTGSEYELIEILENLSVEIPIGPQLKKSFF